MRGFASSKVIVMAMLLTIAGCKGDGAEAGGPGGGPGGGPPGEMKLPVEAATLVARPLSASIEATGTLRADESVSLRPEVAGRITRIAFNEGEPVQDGQVLFVLDPALADAEVREAQAMAEVTRTALRRADSMAARSLISKAEIDKLRADASVMDARAASARTRLAKTRILAPFAGHAGLREVSVGEFVNAGQALVTLVRLDPMEVEFSLPETQLSRVAVGQTVRLGVDAYRDRLFDGTVVAIDPMIDPASRSAKVRARVANGDGMLRPGLSTRLLLGVGAPREAIMLPEQALLQEGDERYVYRIVGGKARRTTVRTGQRQPGEIEIVSGLKAGDQVIVAGQAKPMMHDGAGVMVVPGEAAAPASGAAPTAAKSAAAPAEPPRQSTGEPGTDSASTADSAPARQP